MNQPCNFFVILNYYILTTTMVLYAIQEFNASDSKAGLASSMFIEGSVFARILASEML